MQKVSSTSTVCHLDMWRLYCKYSWFSNAIKLLWKRRELKFPFCQRPLLNSVSFVNLYSSEISFLFLVLTLAVSNRLALLALPTKNERMFSHQTIQGRAYNEASIVVHTPTQTHGIMANPHWNWQSEGGIMGFCQKISWCENRLKRCN